ncbi:helix-turn-helix domain-containing protein [Haladaptatus sp. AB643]|uniref:helix-turn-helix domain-containing protein n=1 Tax=unclassified Haladaptatus TaxID=2622732 RepID=UPI00209BEDE8|nr:helix-turn-helix domain-containing protein [Haladaptatus sp. AB643]MCO8255924.1 helix-turn-helix domain-containing protein [Haladaptatus sp. AB618]
MNVVVDLRLPREEFALHELFQYRSDVRIELEQIVPTREYSIPFVWVATAEPAFLDTVAFDQSPIDSMEVLSRTENGALCRVVWASATDGIHGILTEGDLTLLDAVGNDDGWLFRIRFPDHESTTKFREACDDRSITYEVRRIYTVDEFPAKQYGLTDEQREALATAFASGYFRVPRETSLSELAETLDISPQAASGRLRRGLERMLGATLFPRTGPSDISEG